jgi:penicillin-binding protein 2
MSLIPPSAPGAAQKEFRPRLAWATGVVVLAFLVLVGRLYFLQILHGDEYKEQADENFVKEIRTPADRGLFLDRSGQVLVDSRPSYDVTLTPYFCGKTCDEVLSRVATMLQMSPEEVARARQQLVEKRKLERFRPFTVKVDIPRGELDRYLANQMDLPGVDVQPVPHRNYRYASMGGHLIGYMNEVGPDELKRLNEGLDQAESEQGPYLLGDYVGRRGLERRFERELRGIDGKERVPVDAKGRRKADADMLIPEDQRVVPSIPGNNLVLSLDWRLQEFAEQTFPATAGVVAAMDAKTGFILALVDRPAPDPNKMSGRVTPAELAAIHADPLQPELFRAIQQHYHPGSTFKALTAVAALEEGIFKPETTVFCPGHFQMGRARWRCDKEQGHGWVDFEHALGASCDVFFYDAGARLGADLIAKWGRRSGLGTPTGFDVGGEIPGVIPDEAWHDAHIPGGYQRGMAVNLAIGQGDVNVTPMQQLVFYGALATGTIWRPQVVMRVEDPDGKVLQTFKPEARGQLDIKKSTRDTVLKGLLAAVNQPFGTGYGVRPKDFVAAGKTGTAQVVKLGARRLKAAQVTYFERDHAWFATFAPVEDPQLVVVVLNEHSGFGAANAAPTAMAVMKKYMELKAQDAAAAHPGAGVATAAPGAVAGTATPAPGTATAAVAEAPSPTAAPARAPSAPAAAPVTAPAEKPAAKPAVRAAAKPVVAPAQKPAAPAPDAAPVAPAPTIPIPAAAPPGSPAVPARAGGDPGRGAPVAPAGGPGGA